MPGLFVKYHGQALLPHAKVSVLQVIGEERHDGPLIEFDFREEDGLSTQRVYYRKQPGRLGKILDIWNYVYCSFKGYSLLVAREGKADLHHVHVLTRAGFLPWFIRICGGAPYLVTEHWSRYLPVNRHKFMGTVRLWLTRQVVKRAFAVCPVNENLGLAMRDMGFENPRFRVVNNVVDTLRFQPAVGEVSSKRFLHVSCFDEVAKNAKGLLRAFQRAVETDPSLFLTLVGEGPDWEEIKHYAGELNLDHYVDFAGLKMGDELVRAYQENACLILFSHYENQPVVILEAFACGIPVISTRVGGIPSMLENGRGILLEDNDEKGLAEAILDVAGNRFSYSKAELVNYVKEQYSYEAVGKLYAELYQQALA